MWFTDESQTERGTGMGIHGDRPRANISFSLGQHSTVFQAEMLVITTCAQENLRRGYRNKHIYIRRDTQAALGALSADRFRSTTALDCRRALDILGEYNRVSLIWVPAHCGIEGNERADKLVREGSESTFVGPEPTLGIALSVVRAKIKN